MAALGLCIVWIVLIWIQRPLVRKYEQETDLCATQAIRTAHHLMKFFGPAIRACFYSMHLAIVSSVPEALLHRSPGYRDLAPRAYLLEHFTLSDRILARVSAVVALIVLILVFIAEPPRG